MVEEQGELLRRAEDLARRCQRSGEITHTGFLTPAQAYTLEQWASHADCTVLFSGGGTDNERKAAFFLPDWMDPDAFAPETFFRALEITARFGEPGHRDYLGAALGLGVDRAWIGDIRISGGTAWLWCMPSVKEHLLHNLDKVGRYGVKVREIPPEQVPTLEREVREITFSVKSLRLDAVCAGLFSCSRSAAAGDVAQGLVSLNYTVCLKPDAPVKAGDVLSCRGKGKGIIREAGEKNSRRGRLIVRAER